MNRVATKVQRHLDRVAQAKIDAVNWTPPAFSMPLPIDEGSLVLLGETRGRRYWQHPQHGELEERVGRLVVEPPISGDDGDSIGPFAIPNGPIIATIDEREAEDRDLDGKVTRTYTVQRRAYRVLTPVAPGTWESKSNEVVPIAEIPEARLVDALASHELFSRTATSYAAAVHARGCDAILARLAVKRVVVRMTADRSDLIILAPDGRVRVDFIAAVNAAKPLLLPYLRDAKAPSCGVSTHDAEAVTIAAPGVPWCGSCTAEDDR